MGKDIMNHLSRSQPWFHIRIFGHWPTP